MARTSKLQGCTTECKSILWLRHINIIWAWKFQAMFQYFNIEMPCFDVNGAIKTNKGKKNSWYVVFLWRADTISSCYDLPPVIWKAAAADVRYCTITMPEPPWPPAVRACVNWCILRTQPWIIKNNSYFLTNTFLKEIASPRFKLSLCTWDIRIEKLSLLRMAVYLSLKSGFS